MKIIVNGQPRETNDGVSIAELLRQLQLPPEQVAVEVNLELVPKAKHEQCSLSEGDELELVRFVGGG